CGELEPGVAHRRPDALTRLLDGPVGEPDDGEAGQPGGDVGLDGDGDAGQALEGAAQCSREHTLSSVASHCCVCHPAAAGPLPSGDLPDAPEGGGVAERVAVDDEEVGGAALADASGVGLAEQVAA